MDKPDITEVLAEVNRLRADHGIGGPLTELPTGARLIAHKCPIAHAVDGGATYLWLAPGLPFDDAWDSLVVQARGHDAPYGEGVQEWREYYKAHAFPDGLIRTPEVVEAFMRAHDNGDYPELIA